MPPITAILMSELRDSIYSEQLARIARANAAATTDRDVALRLKEAAIKHERKARKLRRLEEKRPSAEPLLRKRSLKFWMPQFKARPSEE